MIGEEELEHAHVSQPAEHERGEGDGEEETAQGLGEAVHAVEDADHVVIDLLLRVVEGGVVPHAVDRSDDDVLAQLQQQEAAYHHVERRTDVR